MGILHHVLGIEVTRTSQCLFLSQTKYARDLLEKTSMLGCKPCRSPCGYKKSLRSDQPAPLDDPHSYRSITGALQYLTLTGPDLSFAVNQACWLMHHPNADLVAVKRILRYMKGTMTSGILLQRGNLQLTAFSDTDWAGDPDDRCSTSGFCVFLGSCPVFWCAKKQHTIARSFTEAEYRSLAHAAAEVSWLCILLCDLKVLLPNQPSRWCDNISAVSLASNPVSHARTKHVEVDYHFVREKVLLKTMGVRYVNTQYQIADIFTRGLHPQRFQFLQSKLLGPQPPDRSICLTRGIDKDGLKCNNSCNT